MFFDSLRPIEERQRLAFMLMGFCGLRISEAVRVRLDDFTPDFKFLTVHNTKAASITRDEQGKITGRKPRQDQVPIPDFLVPVIKQYIMNNYSTFRGGYIFPCLGHGGKVPHMSKVWLMNWFMMRRRELGLLDVAYMVNRAGKSSRVYRIGTHSFRRFYVTNVYEKSGGDLLFTKELARHIKVDTTQRYVNCYDFLHRSPGVVSKLREFFDGKPSLAKNQKRLEEFAAA